MLSCVDECDACALTLLVSSSAELRRLCSDLAAAEQIAVDTEFIRERTYYPRLCLVQLAADSVLACVDTIAITDLEPLFEMLQTATITKVLHAARQDLEILLQPGAAVPAPIRDTQIAADLCGIGNQAGLAALSAELLNIEVDKTLSRADWTQRPLPARLLNYAADDVRNLLQLYETLATRLRDLGRFEWFVEDCQRLEDASLYSTAPEQAWQRVSGIRRLSGHRFHAARLMASWREKRAMEIDQPRAWVLRDRTLIQVASELPASKQQLSEIDGIPPAVLRHCADSLLDAVAQAQQVQDPAPPRPGPLSPTQKKRAQIMSQELEQTAKRLDIPAPTLATSREIKALARGETSTPVLSGWRRQVVGEHLLELSADVS